MKLAVAFVVAALAAPAVAHAEDAVLVSRDVPLRAERALASSTTPFDLVGLHWRGSGGVEFRTRSAAGRWSGWRIAAPEAEDRPNRDTPEATRLRGWQIGNPYWTGTSDRLEIRTRGRVTRVRAHYVRSATVAVPSRTVAIAESPPVLPRLAWNANESIRRAPPSYAGALTNAVVHHTAGSNSYSRAQSAAVVRAIQVYHVQGNGWNDIGYNFLVDKYGQVFEGRFGGVDKNVVGAHAEGFNTGSVGVAVIGNYGAVELSAAARASLVKLLAWRFDVAHVDPLSSVNQLSSGNPRFPTGVPVTLRAVAGHRDTGFTSCPGGRVYAQLGSIARAVAASGAPKLYAPVVKGAVGGPVRFTARLSAALPWLVTVADTAGTVVATGSGTGTAIDWTWDASTAPPGQYAYSISAGPAVRTATGVVGGGQIAALALKEARAAPAILTPNGDGRADSTTISYTLTVPATVTATLADPSGKPVAILFSEQKLPGKQSFVFSAEGVVDGTYRIVLTARSANGKQATARISVLVSRTLSNFAVATPVISPNGDGVLDSARFAFVLGAPAVVKLRILRKRAWVATVFDGRLEQKSHELTWGGTKRTGRLVDGAYVAELSVKDASTTVAQQLPLRVDTTPPKVKVVSVSRLTFRVDEPTTLTLTVNGRRLTHEAKKAGLVRVPFTGVPRRFVVLARDAAGNAGRALRWP